MEIVLGAKKELLLMLSLHDGYPETERSVKFPASVTVGLLLVEPGGQNAVAAQGVQEEALE